ncbi:MAG: hypothetical protein U1A73_06970 [Pseudomonas sp.]|nr:hypothetical protein [Pseudomonas sp.]
MFTDAATDTVAVMDADVRIGASAQARKFSVRGDASNVVGAFEHNGSIGVPTLIISREPENLTVANTLMGTFTFVGSRSNGDGLGAEISSVAEAPSTDRTSALIFVTGDANDIRTEKVRVSSGGNLGLNNTNPQHLLDLALGTLTAQKAGLNIAGTWNNAAVTFDGVIFANITDSASASASLLLDLQIGGVSKYKIDKAGNTTVGGNLSLPSTGSLLWSTDLVLLRDAANILAQRNATTAQAFRLYNTFTDASNYERLSLAAVTGGAYTLTSEAAGTGTVRNIALMGGNVGIATTAPTNLVSLGGNAARTIWMERHTTANTAGNALTVQAGGATSAATDKAGGALILQPGLGTGNGVAGLLRLQGDAASPTSGTTDHTLVDRLIPNAFKVLTNNSAIAVINATIANGSAVGGLITYTIEVTDGTDYQVETGQAVYSSQNKAGTVAGTITEINSQQNLSAGTLATTWAISNANPAVISVNANSSLTPSSGYPRITFQISNLAQQAIAIA